ncbi:hypothetical protein A9X02_09280 [Mycobacterium malmoense]|nr:hypothetical protein A9X02_09280 [Mycobacterium malmoense]
MPGGDALVGTAGGVVSRAWRLWWRSVAMRWARFWARVRVRSGIIAVRCPQRSATGTGVSGGSPVGAHSVGNSNALPGVVT